MGIARIKRMSPPAKAFFFGMVLLFAILGFVALVAGWWPYTVASLVLGAAFFSSAPFVLSRGWRPPPPKPTRRPVVRKRR